MIDDWGEWIPLDGDSSLLLETVGEVQLLVTGAVFVDEFGYFYVETTVLGDLAYLALAPPADGLEAVAGFADAECRLCDGIEREAVAELGLDIEHQVQGPHMFLEVEDRVTEQHLVIKIDHVESYDEVGPH